VKQSTRRLLAFGSNATLVSTMVLAVMVLLYVLADSRRIRVDLSEGASNTLQAETLQKLSLLDSDGQSVIITAFTSQRGKEESPFKDQAVEDLLKALDERSALLEWRLLDFDKERITAEKLGVTEYGHVVIQRGTDRVDIKDRELFRRSGKGADRKIEFLGEAAVSRAFSQLMTPSRKVVYIVGGHGELSVDASDPGGLSELAAALDRERYDVEPLNLLASDNTGALPEVPEDASVVLLARPRQPLTPQEEDALLGWLGRGGGLAVWLDVGVPVPAFLRRLGVNVLEGVALQPEMQVPYRDRPIPRYKSHAITSGLLDEQISTVLAFPAPLQLVDPFPEGVAASVVLQTTRDGWIDRGGTLEGGGAVFEPGLDSPGPVDLAVAIDLRPGGGIVRPGRPAARVFVSGDSDQFANVLLGEGPGNAAFALNVIHWLAGDDRRLGVVQGAVGRSTRSRRLAVTEEDTRVINGVALGLMPMLVALLGIITWFSRRGR